MMQNCGTGSFPLDGSMSLGSADTSPTQQGHVQQQQQQQIFRTSLPTSPIFMGSNPASRNPSMVGSQEIIPEFSLTGLQDFDTMNQELNSLLYPGRNNQQIPVNTNNPALAQQQQPVNNTYTCRSTMMQIPTMQTTSSNGHPVSHNMGNTSSLPIQQQFTGSPILVHPNGYTSPLNCTSPTGYTSPTYQTSPTLQPLNLFQNNNTNAHVMGGQQTQYHVTSGGPTSPVNSMNFTNAQQHVVAVNQQGVGSPIMSVVDCPQSPNQISLQHRTSNDNIMLSNDNILRVSNGSMVPMQQLPQQNTITIASPANNGNVANHQNNNIGSPSGIQSPTTYISYNATQGLMTGRSASNGSIIANITAPCGNVPMVQIPMPSPDAGKLRFPSVDEYSGFLDDLRKFKTNNPQSTNHIRIPETNFTPTILSSLQSIENQEEFQATFNNMADQQDDPNEKRTTMMLRNIPNKYTQPMLLKTLDENRFTGMYDFFYLPIDFRNRCNVGYAFINFCTPLDAKRFLKTFHKFKLKAYNSPKVCEVNYARVQGLQANIEVYRNSPVNGIPIKQYRPLIFRDGEEEDFPQPDAPLPPIQLRYENCMEFVDRDSVHKAAQEGGGGAGDNSQQTGKAGGETSRNNEEEWPVFDYEAYAEATSSYRCRSRGKFQHGKNNKWNNNNTNTSRNNNTNTTSRNNNFQNNSSHHMMGHNSTVTSGHNPNGSHNGNNNSYAQNREHNHDQQQGVNTYHVVTNAPGNYPTGNYCGGHGGSPPLRPLNMNFMEGHYM